ncbi:MAG: ABC transporter ATP-binding protein [Coriobacteriales bacterium]|jgi:iron complex transport system ATP-binding protein|nr:ABC transporter ATP-binding protein [Coriobacteriales bacterium]
MTPSPLLTVRDLVCGYHRKTVVHGISFQVRRGEFVCIIGANGCGKTTALKAVLGLIKPFSGSVVVDGREAISMSERELARHFAYIPQAHAPPFPFSVADVVMLGRTPYVNRLARVGAEDRQIAYHSLVQLGIQDLAERTYTRLSGGQQQLVLIARALTQQPDVLVMDEPTASLDFGNQQVVLSRMRSLVDGGTSVLMVTHDPSHAFYCADRVLVMHQGRLIADGPPAEVITTGSMKEVYHTDVCVTEVQVGEGRKESVCIPLH